MQYFISFAEDEKETANLNRLQATTLDFVIMTSIMIKAIVYLLPVYLLIISACGSQQIPTQPSIAAATANQEQDPCSSGNLPATVEGINDLMREFDDTSQLASDLDAQGLPEVISNLQRIRREAEDLQIPPCLGTLKTHQLKHMNLMIQTLIAFVGGSDQGTLTNGLEMARQEHNLYSLELVRLLGITLAPITATPPASQETPTASSTP